MIELDCGIIERISFFSNTKEKIDDLCRILAGGTGTAWELVICQNNLLGDRPIFDSHTIEKICLGTKH